LDVFKDINERGKASRTRAEAGKTNIHTVMRIFNSLNSDPDQLGSGHEFPPAARR
jgi:hypothetical protein